MRIRIYFLLILLSMTTIVLSPANAEEFNLFTQELDSPVAAAASASPDGVGGSNVLDSATEKLIASGAYNNSISASIAIGSVVNLTLLGKTEAFEVKNVVRKANGSVSYYATGAGQNSIAIAQNNGQIVGSLIRDGELIKIRTTADGTTVLIEVAKGSLSDHGSNYQEGNSAIELAPRLEVPTRPNLDPQSALGAGDVNAAAVSGDIYTVIIAYTPDFVTDLVGGLPSIPAYLDLLEMETNTGYANSGITTRVRILGNITGNAVPTNYTPRTNSHLDDVRYWLYNQNDPDVAKLYAQRNDIGADLMIILTGNGVTESCGWASGIPTTQNRAFAFVRENCGTGNYTFAHEIGHLFGAHHNINRDPDLTPYAYGHGYCSTVKRAFRTVMAYNCPPFPPGGNDGPRILQWSNPNTDYTHYFQDSCNFFGCSTVTQTEPMGTAATEHNARVMDDHAVTIANFRVGPAVSSPSPAEGATVIEGTSGQVLQVRNPLNGQPFNTTAAVFYYGDDINDITNTMNAGRPDVDHLAVTVPYAAGKLSSNGPNYWYVQVFNAAGVTRYPSSGAFMFTVTPATPLPVVSVPNPADGASVTAGNSGHLFEVLAPNATSGVLFYGLSPGVITNVAELFEDGDNLSAGVPYSAGKLINNGTNYWYVLANNAGGQTRYPSTGSLSFTTTPPIPLVVVSNPNPANTANIAAGNTGQFFEVMAPGATSGVIHYDVNDDGEFFSEDMAISVSGTHLEAGIPYATGRLSKGVTNYWYIEATNAGGTVRYPASGTLSFVPVPSIPLPVASNPEPADGATVAAGNSGQELKIMAPSATSGVFYYNDDSQGESISATASVQGDYLVLALPYGVGSINADGTNYWSVEATNAGGTVRYPAFGSLSFTVTPPPTTADSYESDNDATEASEISSGASQMHSIFPVADTDWVKFTHIADGDVSIETNGAIGDTRMWLFAESLGAALAFDDDSGNNRFSKITMPNMAAGTYFVQVEDFGNNSEIPSYTVKATYSSADGDFMLDIIPAIISATKKKRVKQ